MGRKAQLGQGPVPLGPGRLWAVGQIDGLHYFAPLPSAVCSDVGPPERVDPDGDVSPPHPA